MNIKKLKCVPCVALLTALTLTFPAYGAGTHNAAGENGEGGEIDVASAENIKKMEEDLAKVKEELKRTIDYYGKRVEELEKKHDKKKLLAISGDLDFLEELVFSNSASTSIFDESQFDSTSPCLPYVSSTGLEVSAIYGENIAGVAKNVVLGGGQRKVVFKSGNVEIRPSPRCRLELIEKQLFKPEQADKNKDESLKVRVDEVYNELNFEDWQNENLRFGANVGYIRSLGVQTASVAFHVFPSYRRHSPGNLDFWRRGSVFLGLGNVFSGSGDIDVESAVLSAGVGIEVIRGVSLNYGYSVFDSENDKGVKEHSREKTVSFSLRSEFWSSLFGSEAKN